MTDVDVLVRCVDAGDTYVVWRWLDAPDRPYADRLQAADFTGALAELTDSLFQAGAQDSLRSGCFATLDRERGLARRLGRVVLPAELRQQVASKYEAGVSVRIRLIPSPRLSQVPWETLAVDDEDRRLLDIAGIVYDLPATVAAERGRTPAPWTAALPGLHIIDPALPHTDSMRRVLLTDNAATGLFQNRIENYYATHGERFYGSVGARIGRVKLSALLAEPRSRFFYFGHVTATPEEPGSAALHLTDPDATVWGLAEPIAGHRPLCALDLLAGVADAPDWYRAKFGSNDTAGHNIWPMPPRVAMISCEGAADYRATETFGLISAMVKAGAELVTTTRWALPTDSALWAMRPELKHAAVRPTTELALEVDSAHTLDDPVSALASWQRGQLNQWRGTGDVAFTPLIWASLTHTCVGNR